MRVILKQKRVLHAAGGALWLLGSVALGQSSLDRPRDPVVLEGADLPWLVGAPVLDVVGFRYAGGWVQIPVQVDERKIVSYQDVYNIDIGLGELTTLAYADSGTYCGSDGDPLFDADDEIVWMAFDAGGRAPGGAALPAGALVGSGVEVEIGDPLDGGLGYVYLFESDGSLAPDAGQDYVDYSFELLAGSGDYFDVYDTTEGPNPENSVAISPFYRVHFDDRWIRNEINVFAGAASGVDLLDRHKNMFGPGVCFRTEDTFSAGEGAFFANKDGPVRCIRSYMGANSGPLTQRDHHFYEQREDVTTFLRVHPIPGIMDIFDYEPGATGMTYYNDLNPGGVAIDGVPDALGAGQLVWELVTGAHGSLAMAFAFETDIPGWNYTSYYSDDATPPTTQCTGDSQAFGTSGIFRNSGIPNTDPASGPTVSLLTEFRTVYYEAPDQTIELAALRYQQATVDLVLSATPFAAGGPPTVIRPASIGPASLDEELAGVP